MDSRPEWYERAAKGPFEKGGFTAEHAENVLRTIREGKPRRARERLGSPYVKTAVAACIALTVAGLGWAAADGSLLSYRGMGNVFSTASGAVKEADMKKTADKALQDLLGISLPFEGAERVKNEKLMRYTYREGDNIAYFWINTETGAMMKAKVTSSLKPDQSVRKLSDGARAVMATMGYKGDFAYSASRNVDYDAAKDEKIEVRTVFRAVDAWVEIINGDIEMMSFEPDVGTLDSAITEEGIKALKFMNKNRTNLTVTGAYRSINGTIDLLTLRFGGEAYVTMDPRSRVIYGVTDTALFDGKSDSAKVQAERDKKLLEVSEQQIRSATEGLLPSTYSPKLKDYQLKKNPKAPGVATFTHSGWPDIEVSYNLSGKVWRFEISPVVAEK
ncbi:hypothetical protein D3C75_261230 [compost metagenome]